MDTEGFRPHIMIVGAGLGGLTLAAILEHTDIPYTVYEKAPLVKPVGSAIVLGANVMYMLKQLDLTDALYARSKVVSSDIRIYKETSTGTELTTVLGYQTGEKEKARVGFNAIVIARPALYDILLSKIPREKIIFGKRVLSQAQSDNGVMIRCADNTTYSGDILVGADGAYSSIRQSLYKQLDDAGRLPKSDKAPMQMFSVCLIGQTVPLDPRKYPEVQENFSYFDYVLGSNSSYGWVLYTTVDKTVCWMVIERLTSESRKVNDTFRNTEWSSEAAEAMCNVVREFPITFGKKLTLGDIIDETPKDLISKMMMDEKMYETWFGGRIVLMGDGSMNAIQDAAILANFLNTLRTNDMNDITAAFSNYREERFELAKQAVESNRHLGILVSRGALGFLVRLCLNHAPTRLWNMVSRVSVYRPQISFLPQILDNGTHKRLPQPSLKTTRPKDAPTII
ncbi:hypothetical protein BGZ51_002542 [Haplosporangium sp. Z 767]|nr:hypothetical protein BGZ51_002542 [Haplosporangium sp. Z 767]